MASKSEPKDIVLRSQTVSRLEKLPEPIISYAQNFEDVMLWRALGHIENGFYIDIGAQHPTMDSVSKAFHDAGWKGVHVDPNPFYAEMLREERIGDTVLEVAVGRSEGTLDFYAINGTGLSTGDPDIAEMHRKAGREVVECSVPMTTLKQVLADIEQPDIHWLKIDVEGMEGEVLAGWGTSKIRPWVLVVETVVMGSNTSPIEEWNSLILKKGYTLAFDDGLNLYYVNNKNLELLVPLSYGPNVFDEFQMSATSGNTFNQILKIDLQKISLENNLNLEKIEALYNSKSWKITNPIRYLNKKILELKVLLEKVVYYILLLLRKISTLIIVLIKKPEDFSFLFHRFINRIKSKMRPTSVRLQVIFRKNKLRKDLNYKMKKKIEAARKYSR